MDMKKRQLMILTVFVGGLTGSIPVIKAQEWRLMSREEIEAKVHPLSLIHICTGKAMVKQ